MHVLADRRSAEPRSRWVVVDPDSQAAGIVPKWRLHDLRHWTARAAIRSGHDLRTVAGRLGHANPAMKMRVYAHVVGGADRAVAESLGRALDDDDS